MGVRIRYTSVSYTLYSLFKYVKVFIKYIKIKVGRLPDGDSREWGNKSSDLTGGRKRFRPKRRSSETINNDARLRREWDRWARRLKEALSIMVTNNALYLFDERHFTQSNTKFVSSWAISAWACPAFHASACHQQRSYGHFKRHYQFPLSTLWPYFWIFFWSGVVPVLSRIASRRETPIDRCNMRVSKRRGRSSSSRPRSMPTNGPQCFPFEVTPITQHAFPWMQSRLPALPDQRHYRFKAGS